jgi:prolyl-tRNA synthetase
MKQSQLFTKTRREAPADETSRNAQLLIRAGYIHKEMAGVYSILPLGFKVLNKIKQIVNEEMEALGSQEIIMSTLQKKENWEVTDRWSDEKVDVWFKSKLKNDTEIGFGWSHEEPITFMVKDHIQSYKDLPVFVHQFQNKMRNETRAKSGIMRCREFVMKDMYSYCVDEAKHMEFYNKTIDAYMNVYRRVGLGDITYVTSASGGVFTDKFSHEFQTICEAGEDNIYVHKTKPLAINEEVYSEETLKKLDAKAEDFELKKAAEVGNIFTFGTGKCEQIGLNFTDIDGIKKPVYLGSYGIGVTRLLGVITEVMSDEAGIVWPEAVAPFSLHMVTLFKDKNEEAYKVSEQIYTKLKQAGVDVLWDDREGLGAGEKFADADLLGMPLRATISQKSLLAGGVELKERKEKDNSKTEIISIEHLVAMYTKEC